MEEGEKQRARGGLERRGIYTPPRLIAEEGALTYDIEDLYAIAQKEVTVVVSNCGRRRTAEGRVEGGSGRKEAVALGGFGVGDGERDVHDGVLAQER